MGGPFKQAALYFYRTFSATIIRTGMIRTETSTAIWSRAESPSPGLKSCLLIAEILADISNGKLDTEAIVNSSVRSVSATITAHEVVNTVAYSSVMAVAVSAFSAVGVPNVVIEMIFVGDVQGDVPSVPATMTLIFSHGLSFPDSGRMMVMPTFVDRNERAVAVASVLLRLSV